MLWIEDAIELVVSSPLSASSFASGVFGSARFGSSGIVRVPVVDLGLHERRKIFALPASDRPQVVREEVVAHARAAMVRQRVEDRLRRQRGAAVLMAADA